VHGNVFAATPPPSPTRVRPSARSSVNDSETMPGELWKSPSITMRSAR
jgi:hypothetical protein